MAGSTAALRSRVTEATGQNPFRCYQCGNCSAGCPMAGHGDMLPHQVFRMLQLGSDEPLKAIQPWLCVGCQTCAVRCPQELDLSRVMDYLRSEAVRAKTVPAGAKRMYHFNRIFLARILANGRLNEVELGILFNLANAAPLENAFVVPSLMTRGKFKLPGGKHAQGPGRAVAAEGRP
jgi:heterodisulfide reductase subunit C2